MHRSNKRVRELEQRVLTLEGMVTRAVGALEAGLATTEKEVDILKVAHSRLARNVFVCVSSPSSADGP